MDINATSIGALNRAAITVWKRGYEGYQSYAKRLCMVNTDCKTGQAVYAWLGNLPSMRVFSGDLEKQTVESADWTVKNGEFAMGWDIPRLAIQRDQFGVYSNLFAEASERAAWHPDQLMAALLKGGFSQKDYTTKNFFDSDKSHVKGTTKGKFTNKSTKKLTADYFAAGRAALAAVKDPGGIPFNVKPSLALVVSPDNMAMGEKIIQATLVGGGDTNTNAGKAELIVNEFLDGPEWFLINTAGSAKALIWQEEIPTAFTSKTDPKDENVFKNEVFSYKAYGVYTLNYGLPQRIYGSTGADA